MVRRFLDAVFCFRGRPGILAAAMLISVAFHMVAVVNVLAACTALGVPARVLDLAVLVPLVLLVASVPVSLNALGVMEGAFVYFLSSVGMAPSDALSVALILRAKELLLALVGVVWFSLRFFSIFPKAQPPRIGPAKPPPAPVILAILNGGFAVVTALLALILWGEVL